jgi:hypothetical protein
MKNYKRINTANSVSGSGSGNNGSYSSSSSKFPGLLKMIITIAALGGIIFLKLRR